MMYILLIAGFWAAQDVDALVRELGHDDADRREAAEAELLRVGAPALKALRDAAASTGDAEVRARAERLVRAIPFRDVLGIDAGREFALASGGLDKIDALIRLKAGTEEVDRAAGLLLADAVLDAFPWKKSYDDARDQRDLFALRERTKAHKLKSLAWLYVRLTEHAAPYVRLHGVTGLGELGAAKHADRLADLLKDPDARVRGASVGALAALGAAAPQIAALLKDPDADVRMNAVEALAGLRRPTDLVDALSDASARVRAWAAFHLEALGAREALDALKKARAAEKNASAAAGMDAAIRDLEAMKGERRAVASGEERSGDDSRIDEASYLRIASAEDWKALWRRHADAEPPDVDWSRHEVVAVFQGDGISHGVQFGDAFEDDETVTVRFCGVYKQTMGPAPRTAAFGMIVLPRSKKPIAVEEDVHSFKDMPPVWKARARLQ